MDLRKLKTLIDLVSESNVSELEITEAEGKVRIVKSSGAAPTLVAAPVVAAVAPAPVAAAHSPQPPQRPLPKPHRPRPRGMSSSPRWWARFIARPALAPRDRKSTRLNSSH